MGTYSFEHSFVYTIAIRIFIPILRLTVLQFDYNQTSNCFHFSANQWYATICSTLWNRDSRRADEASCALTALMGMEFERAETKDGWDRFPDKSHPHWLLTLQVPYQLPGLFRAETTSSFYDIEAKGERGLHSYDSLDECADCCVSGLDVI